MSIAFFDLDRTLLALNSAWPWMKFELAEGHLTWFQVAQAALYLTGYHLSIGSLEKALYKAVAAYAGETQAELDERTGRFYERVIRGRYRPGGQQALAAHRLAGDAVVLLTTSSNFLSERVVADLDLDGYLCNRYVVDAAGRLTGEPVLPLCFGQGKVTLAARYAAARGVGLVDCTFYSDSLSDLPMLEASGRPVVVNPDPRLRRLAARRGWERVDWGEPQPT